MQGNVDVECQKLLSDRRWCVDPSGLCVKYKTKSIKAQTKRTGANPVSRQNLPSRSGLVTRLDGDRHSYCNPSSTIHTSPRPSSSSAGISYGLDKALVIGSHETTMYTNKVAISVSRSSIPYITSIAQLASTDGFSSKTLSLVSVSWAAIQPRPTWTDSFRPTRSLSALRRHGTGI